MLLKKKKNSCRKILFEKICKKMKEIQNWVKQAKKNYEFAGSRKEVNNFILNSF